MEQYQSNKNQGILAIGEIASLIFAR